MQQPLNVSVITPQDTQSLLKKDFLGYLIIYLYFKSIQWKKAAVQQPQTNGK